MRYNHPYHMQRTSVFILISFAALGLLGLADSLYLAFAYYTDTALVCNVLDGCNIVAQSSYSNIFGVPLAYWGVLYYAGVVAIAAGLWLRLMLVDRLRWLVLGYATLGALMSAYFFYVQFAVIEAFCIYCLISGVSTWLLFILTLFWFRRIGRHTGTPVDTASAPASEPEEKKESEHADERDSEVDEHLNRPQNVR